MTRNARQNFKLSQVKTPVDAVALVIGTFFGAGLLPWAPGTWGTLAAVPLTWYLHLRYPNPFQPEAILFWVLLFLIGSWACKHVCKITGTSDNQILVIDEVVGYGICAALAGISWEMLTICFFLFRVLDISKIPPVRQFDALSKNSTNVWIQGFGVMMDDALAGFQGLLLFYFTAPSLMSFLSRSAG